MLTEKQCEGLEMALTQSVEPRKVAAYLCLHMGLMVAEITALRFGDIDFEAGTITVRNIIARPEGAPRGASAKFTSFRDARVLPIPSYVWDYLKENRVLYKNEECFVLTGKEEVPAFHHIQNILTSISVKYDIADTLSASDLRNAFIRRCILSGMDLYSLCVYIGIKQPNVIVRRFGSYFTPHLESVEGLTQFLVK